MTALTATLDLGFGCVHHLPLAGLNEPRAGDLVTSGRHADGAARVPQPTVARAAPGRMQGRVHAIAHHLLDQVQSRGEMDLIDEYAFPLPIMVIAELLGIPPRDHGRFRKWSYAVVKQPSDPEEAKALSVLQEASRSSCATRGCWRPRRRTRLTNEQQAPSVFLPVRGTNRQVCGPPTSRASASTSISWAAPAPRYARCPELATRWTRSIVVNSVAIDKTFPLLLIFGDNQLRT